MKTIKLMMLITFSIGMFLATASGAVSSNPGTDPPDKTILVKSNESVNVYAVSQPMSFCIHNFGYEFQPELIAVDGNISICNALSENSLVIAKKINDEIFPPGKRTYNIRRLCLKDKLPSINRYKPALTALSKNWIDKNKNPYPVPG